MAVALLLTACNSEKKKNYVNEEAWAIEADSTGMSEVYAYEGNVKARGKMPAAHYWVVITEQLDSMNGTYTMTTTYIVADTMKNKPMKSRGKKFTRWGLHGDKSAKVYALAPDSGATDSVFLYVETDTTVVMLDNSMQKPANPEGYRLMKRKDHKHAMNK